MISKEMRDKIVTVCEAKIEKKGLAVQVSFYAFFSNKNDDPVNLMEVARWWIEEHQLNHFERATKIIKMMEALDSSK